MRELIDDCVHPCAKLRGDVAAYVEIEFPEPADDDVAHVRLLIEKVREG